MSWSNKASMEVREKYASISPAFSIGSSIGKSSLDNPIHGLKRGDLQATEEAGRALNDDEIRHIWRASLSLGYPFGPLYQLLLLTGQRRTEWAAASRSEINLDKCWLEIPKARYKGDRDHIVPLAEEALTIVDKLPVWPGNDYFLLS